MSSRPTKRLAGRLLAGVVSLSLALLAAGVANAGAGNPASIHATQTGPLTVSASGTWSWGEMATATKLSYTGYALDWGDVATGNAVPKPGGGSYHIGDGTPATDLVLHPTSPAQGTSGSWGPVTHTYAKAGSYTVCALVYDLGEVTPFKTTGYHSTKAGGVDRNTDNSAEKNGVTEGNCITIDVTAPTTEPTAAATIAPTTEPTAGATTAATTAPTTAPTTEPTAAATTEPTTEPTAAATTEPTTEPTAAATTEPTPTPFQSVQGVTSAPSSTPPPTTTGQSSSTPESGGSIPLLSLLFMLGSGIFAVLFIRPLKETRTR